MPKLQRAGCLPNHRQRVTENNKEFSKSQGEMKEMYQQIKPTEVFRARELALMKEVKNRRLAPRLHARRTLKTRSTLAVVLGFLGALVVAGLMLAASSSPAHAASTNTFTVDNIDDPGDGLCNAQGCTLRDAILAANSTPNLGGPDLIKFDINRIPGVGRAL